MGEGGGVRLLIKKKGKKLADVVLNSQSVTAVFHTMATTDDGSALFTFQPVNQT